MPSLARSPSGLRAFLHSAKQCRFSSSNAVGGPSRPRILPAPRLDYRNISENMVYKSTNALNRKAPLPSDAIQSIARTYTEFKNLQSTLNSRRNARSAVGERIRRSAEEKDLEAKEAAMAEALKIKEEIAPLEAALLAVEENLLSLALAIPNDTHPSSPLGPESAALTLSTHGPEPIPPNPERDHVTIARKFGLVDFESGATVTGSSWYYLLNEAALLEMALTNYALSIAIKRGFTPVTTPDVVRSEISDRCGFRPRDNSDPPVSQVYHIHSAKSPDLILVVGLGRAFRAEAGARGRDTHGLYRVHQFTKVELFAVTTQEESEKMMEEMKSLQTAILEGLGLSFRVLDMPTEELGASAYRKYDMEAWMPGRGGWGEVSSLSNCTDYQSRRLHIRYQNNASAATTPTTFDDLGELVAITLPETLRPFWVGGNERTIIQWQ
ncbi:hypothetical protein B0H14DRAFT_2676850 [Mycena olivaceomarginata]|nr:hypothetical protein B0H14DRAFT_2676850 [Mycena olivaceomarginata]